MDNSELAILIGGIVITVFMVMGGVFNLRSKDIKSMKAMDSLTSTGSLVWSYLSPAQQEELNQIDSLLVQEEWIAEHVEASVLNGVSPERVLIELANRGFIILGQGVFRRHSSPLDYINAKAPSITEPAEVSEGPLTKEEAEKVNSDEEPEVQETLEEDAALSEGNTEEEENDGK